MSTKHDNPLWLLLWSLIIFSLVTLLLLLFRNQLFDSHSLVEKRQIPTSHQTPTAHLLSVAIPVLQQKKYTSVPFHEEKVVSRVGTFTSTIISFSVDGLKEYALLDMPNSTPPVGGFPVVVLNHGYITPELYDTVTSYAGPTNFFATHGYIVIKPDYRGNGNSEGYNDALKRFDYPTDVMTVIASLHNIPQANTKKVYLWGHSMGGEVTLTVMEILGKQPNLSQGIKGVVLWAPVTDPAQWFSTDNLRKIPEAQLTPFPYTQTFTLLGEPSDASEKWQSINPLLYLSDITIPLQLNHGTADLTVPYSWSEDLAQKFRQAGKQVDVISYPGADHNLSPVSSEALQNNLQFFQSH